MNSQGLRYVLQEFASRPLPTGVGRELSLPTESGKVIGLSGVRRSGKTFLFFEAMQRLVRAGVPRPRILYLNFEDDRLQPVTKQDYSQILPLQRELFEVARTGRIYLFLDEVQNAPEWERWVRRLHDTEDVSVFVTGSSSQVLTRDLSTALRGRSVTFEVLPLSFREYLHFRKQEVVLGDERSEAAGRAAFADYLQWGGFPEIAMADATMRPLVLEEYASLMFWRDLVDKNRVRNEAAMRAVFRHCMRNTASAFQITKLHRDLSSQGHEVGRATIISYVQMLENAGLVYLLPVASDSVRTQARNPKKLHVVDTGLVRAFLAGSDRDLGHKLETAVFLEARRSAKDWRYLNGVGEIDLCAADGGLALASCFDLGSDDTLQREVRAMTKARQIFPAAEVLLLYHYGPSDLEQRVPGAQQAWKWMLQRQQSRGS